MYNNILFDRIEFNNELAIFALLDTAGINIKHHQDSLINDDDEKSDFDNILSTTANSQANPEAVAMSNTDSLFTGKGKDNIVGIANAVASSDAIATSETKSISEHMFSGIAISKSDAVVEALAIGIDNAGKIATGKGSDTVVGVANVSAAAISEASSQAELVVDRVFDAEVNAQSEATANILAESVGISNLGEIVTGRHDTVIGIANVSATATSSAFSQAKSVFNNNFAIANSESISVIEALAIGIDNIGKIATGSHDVIIGIANTSTMTEADAKAFAYNMAALAPECDRDAIDVETAISQSKSAATADSFTTTLGIINSGEIFTGKGNDLVFGLANNESMSNSEAFSEASAVADDLANANADAKSLAIANGSAVGIANLGIIATGKGHDTIAGVAVNDSVATADANASAVAEADVSDSQVNTDAIANTEEAIAIGIDNVDGVIKTGHGNDRIIGYGAIGIIGGEIYTGKGNDRVIGYGNTVGVEGGVTRLGRGNDYFKADVVDFDPLSGEVWLRDDRSNSIKDAEVFGDGGNDTFELGGFEGTVSIDGGRDYDVLKLWGNVDDYKFTLASSGDRLTVEDFDSELVVKNVETLYFGNSDRSYSFNDFVS